MIPRGLKIRYMHGNKSYLQKIIDDYKGITTSKLSSIFMFDTKKVDAFLINYTLEGKKIIVPKSNIKRIRLCEMVLNETE